MGASYYVAIPGTNFPTAEVSASSSKHARTAYLDYLSRNNLVSWRDRQAIRPKIVTKRMQPGEIQTQVFLDYSAKTIPETEVQVPPQATTPVEEEIVEEEQPAQAQPVQLPQGNKLSVLPPSATQQQQQGRVAAIPTQTVMGKQAVMSPPGLRTPMGLPPGVSVLPKKANLVKPKAVEVSMSPIKVGGK